MHMKTVKTMTTSKDILALVDYICSQKTDMKYKLCSEQEIRLEYSFPQTPPQWIVPVTMSENKTVKYFIFEHQFCSLSVQNEEPDLIGAHFPEKADVETWGSPFHRWIVNKNVVRTVFTNPQKALPVSFPAYWGKCCYYEYQPPCPILFLTPDDVLNAFPFREIVKGVKNIELKITSYNEPVWLLTQNSGKEYIIYPCALHRFYDEPNITHDFAGELSPPQKNEEFMVSHFIGRIICPLLAFKAKNKQELSILRFSEMNLRNQTNFADFIM